jgi:hypothetical protein
MTLNIKEIFSVFKNRYAKSIVFWIIVFFVIRLFNITSAPIEIAHNWRQTFTNTVARNFLEIDNNILYPRAVIFGNNSGVVGTEFPLLNYLIYILSSCFGYEHWYGRLLNLIFSSIGIFYFFKIIKRFVNPSLAFNSAIVLLCSIWFIFSRKSMPDTFSISIIFIGLYYGLSFFEKKKLGHLLAYFFFVTVGVLCKIPGLFLLCIFIIPLLDRNQAIGPKLLFVTASVCSLAIIALWYFKWVPYLDGIHGNKLYFPRTLSEGTKEVMEHLNQTAEKFYFSSLQGFLGFILFLVGLVYLVIRRMKRSILVVSALVIVFFLFIIKTGIVFPLHSYYIIPFTPVMCVIVAFGLEQISNFKLRTLLLLIIIGEGIANQQNDFFIKKDQLYKLQLESIADKFIKKNDLIAVNGGESPQLIYFAHRNGWRITNDQALNTNFCDSLKAEGCKYIILDKHNYDNTFIPPIGVEVYDDEDFRINSLTEGDSNNDL